MRSVRSVTKAITPFRTDCWLPLTTVVRRAGELLKQLPRMSTPNPEGLGGKTGKIVSGARARQQSEYTRAIEDAGLNERTARDYQALAKIPEKDFEDMNESDNPPSERGSLGVFLGSFSSGHWQFRHSNLLVIFP